MDAHEFVKIPELVRHFQEHIQNRSTEASISLMDFIFLHYVDSEHSHAPEHEKLPFHQVHKCAPLFTLFEPQFYSFTFLKAIWIEKAIHPMYSFFVKEISFSFWQPPKISL
jgi:hypothetical protein